MKKANEIYVICYKVVDPVIYNKGTKYEKKEWTFLEYECHGVKDIKQVEKRVAELNAHHERENVDYYYIDTQEPMY